MKTIAKIIVILLLACSGKAFACSCIEPGSVEEEMKRVDVVFAGTVISKKIVGDFQVEYWFKVEAVYKGVTTVKNVKVTTGIGGGDCGYNFTKGERYIVYGWVEGKAIDTNICTRTKNYDIDEEKELIKYSSK